MKLIDKNTTIKRIDDFDFEDFNYILDTIDYGLLKWDLLTDTIALCDNCLNILGLKNYNDHVDLRSLVHPSDLENINENIRNYLFNKEKEFNLQFRVKNNDEYIFVNCKGKILYKDKIPFKIIGLLINLTQSKGYEKQLFNIAFFDSQTKLPNSNLLKKDLLKLCNLQKKFALVSIDINNLKIMNNILANETCDMFLEKITNILLSFSNKDCKLYRRLGEEFIFTIKDVKNTNELIHFVENVQKQLSASLLYLNNNKLFITSSAGISIYPDHDNVPENLIKFALKAMYYSKSPSKNNYAIYSPYIAIKTLNKIKLENDLRLALENNEFQVFYQPQVNINNGKIIGMEALARWIKSDGTIITPNHFIPIAEESGLIVPLGKFILKAACKQAKYWHDQGFQSLKLSVNISEKQLENNDFINTVHDVLNKSKLPPDLLELELTESVAIKDLNNVTNLLKKLKDINVRIALDDFGSGYASFSYLRDLPLNTIKIDKSFMKDIENDYKKKAIVRSMIILSHDMDLNIICEGVETKSQLEFLKSINCDQVQGFYFGKPVSLCEFEKRFLNSL